MARFRAVWVFYRRAVKELLHLGPQTLLVPLLVPAFMLLVFSGLYSEVFARLANLIDGYPGFDGRASYIQYVIAAPLVMAAFWGTSSSGIGVAVERQLGFYDRMQISPLGPGYSQAGRRLADGTRVAVSIIILSFVGLASGLRVPNWPLALATAVSLTAPLGMAYGGIAFSLCVRSGSAESTQAVTPLFLPFLFMSTAFVPLPLVPEWLQPVVANNPMSWICDTIRSAYAGVFAVEGYLKSLAVIGVLGLFSQTLIVVAERRVSLK